MILLAQQAKRWHDLDKSEWMVLVNLIPIIGGIYALINTGFIRGVRGSNRYGPEPLPEELPITQTADNQIAGGLFFNYGFAALAGAIWVCQFVAFKTGEPQMGSQSYVGWAVLMASSIMFSGALGLMLGEWKGTSSKTRGLLGFGLAVLLGSAVLSGYSGKLGKDEEAVKKAIPAQSAMPAQMTAPATK